MTPPHDDSAATASGTLAEFVTETTVSDLPDRGRNAVVRAITDGVGVTLAGLAHESSEITGGFTGRVPRTGIPLDGATGGERAELALHLGTAAHALDYDDLTWAMDGHPTVVLLPPILALTEHVDPTGEDVIEAYAVGFETASYVAEPVSPDHYEAGWHATSTFGAIGATATAASLLDLDVDATRRALTVAASTPSGLKENFGTMTKPLHAGLAARSGVTSALLAADGFTAGDRAIEGDKGFWSLYSGATDAASELPPAPTSEGWTLVDPGIHIKKYPACYFSHTTIAATRSLLDANDIDPETVEAVHVRAAGGARDAIAYTEPETALQSKFSMPHIVAVAMTADRVSVEYFEPSALDDETLAERRNLVEFTVDETLPYDSHAATVTIETATDTYETATDHPPWTHEQPPSRDALEAKFVEAGTQTVDEAAAREAFDRLQALDERRFAEILAPIRA
ncbi:2-methylcitrate dehydratase PrpD [Halanaeroarchaeum sp. HSR-CO]|uniref:MmgE/PrpD family protein n=1 Tax=Halanaeroarchaeum sp. HSR-CO TaxID=2866382 RepID=UPI00217E6386|nr:MmgE/PrpD family protein [Halanaeroarchaeum sp. HSR-CO]UWG46366.1 2-methylcitrate dehydratase PrpD [Halanaeroarchaeum sp. HSR-CO]